MPVCACACAHEERQCDETMVEAAKTIYPTQSPQPPAESDRNNALERALARVCSVCDQPTHPTHMIAHSKALAWAVPVAVPLSTAHCSYPIAFVRSCSLQLLQSRRNDECHTPTHTHTHPHTPTQTTRTTRTAPLLPVSLRAERGCFTAGCWA